MIYALVGITYKRTVGQKDLNLFWFQVGQKALQFDKKKIILKF